MIDLWILKSSYRWHRFQRRKIAVRKGEGRKGEDESEKKAYITGQHGSGAAKMKAEYRLPQG